ncbi:hypothetical protein [Lysinibacillus sp. SGAir0095]|uniref:hypothetical protein n=1 Tax=Lysinibacillus sp. SGAir0095 TaxID=2070463 RepID=UPI0010CD309B|nr:hypothetical protein [Lysinibacillus sp. SGAir0095]QCR32152.1 hypothetical protein C1N55_08190 [Lysinibacillus sp. SGAir0095]
MEEKKFIFLLYVGMSSFEKEDLESVVEKGFFPFNQSSVSNKNMKESQGYQLSNYLMNMVQYRRKVGILWINKFKLQSMDQLELEKAQ